MSASLRDAEDLLKDGDYREATRLAVDLAICGIKGARYVEYQALAARGARRWANWVVKKSASSRDPRGLQEWAWVLWAKGQFGSALKTLDKALLLDPRPYSEWHARRTEWRYWSDASPLVSLAELRRAAEVLSKPASPPGSAISR